ncbi:hypothetical protein [Deferrisoma camini]|uniref:hypothetical protein n=1 Tax=Deferrisoma camini TaxID=1035120 RepID=UPI00046D75CF|nr:hypothetical protein [Deferrisoma camini]
MIPAHPRRTGGPARPRAGARILACLALLGVSACSWAPVRGPESRRVRVMNERPEPSRRPDPLSAVAEVLALSRGDAERAWGASVEEAWVTGSPEARIRVLALAAVLPPSPKRAADLDRLFPPSAEPRGRPPLEELLLRVVRDRPPPRPASPPAGPDPACRRRLSRAEKEAERARKDLARTRERLERQQEENRALQRQIEELKVIERIMEFRNPRTP